MDAVVVTYNSADELGGLLTRPLLQAFDRVIVVDNGSRDGSQAIARSNGAVLVETEANRGFGAAANIGARLTRGPSFGLLNPDIRLPDRSLVPDLARHFADPAVAMVVPRLRLPDGSVQDSVRVVPTPFDLVSRTLVPGQRERGVVRSRVECDVPWAVGAFSLIRRRAFDLVGGFDERFMLYFEDVDLCLRLRRAAWKIRFDPRLEAEHHHRAASRGTLLGWARRQHIRSAALFYKSNPRYAFRTS